MEKNVREIWDNTQKMGNGMVSENPYVSVSNKDLITKLTTGCNELVSLSEEGLYVNPEKSPYDPDNNPEDRKERTQRDVELDIDYNLWELHRVIGELCSRYNVKVG